MRKLSFGIALLIALIVLIAITHYDQSEGQWVDDLKVTLLTNPDPPKVGEVRLTFRITDRSGHPPADVRVTVFYFPVPPAYQVPQEKPVTKVEVSSASKGIYTVPANLDKAGAWKVAVKIQRPDKSPTIAWFTVEVG